MAYVDVSKEVKFNIFKEHLAGDKLTPLARKYHVSRVSICLWIKAATQSVFESFEPDKRGPKFLTSYHLAILKQYEARK